MQAEKTQQDEIIESLSTRLTAALAGKADAEAARSRLRLSGPAEALEALTARLAPIPMLLFCPRCSMQHVDAPAPERGWDDPPHRSHECQACGLVWRPADVATTGVRELKTAGKVDCPAAPSAYAVYTGVRGLSPNAALDEAERLLRTAFGRSGYVEVVFHGECVTVSTTYDGKEVIECSTLAESYSELLEAKL